LALFKHQGRDIAFIILALCMKSQIRAIAKRRSESSPKRRFRSNHPERRLAQRFYPGWDIRIRGFNDAGQSFDMPGELSNLSSSGVFFYLTSSLKPGTQLEIWLKVPMKKNNWIIYTGEAIRVKSTAVMVGVAVKFDSLGPRFRPL
jgi:hypothetical protein